LIIGAAAVHTVEIKTRCPEIDQRVRVVLLV
jgi:hypothetical protein